MHAKSLTSDIEPSRFRNLANLGKVSTRTRKQASWVGNKADLGRLETRFRIASTVFEPSKWTNE